MNTENGDTPLQSAVSILKSFSNERRLVILCNLYKGEKSVGKLEKIVGLSQSALSQHLARLRRDGLVKTRRDAQTIYYSLDNEHAKRILESLYGTYCVDGFKSPDGDHQD